MCLLVIVDIVYHETTTKNHQKKVSTQLVINVSPKYLRDKAQNAKNIAKTLFKRPVKTLLKDNYIDIEKRVAEAYDDLCFKQLVALSILLPLILKLR